MGMQGLLLLAYTPNLVHLLSIFVGRDPWLVHGGQLTALKQALSRRIEGGLRLGTSRAGSRMRPRPPHVGIIE